MNYDVVWPAGVQRLLIELYERAVQGDGRETANLNVALANIDGELRRRPVHAGESRVGRLRVLSVAPLTVYFEVNAQERRVDVVSVNYFVKRR